jgi:hypothetical protein
MFSWDPLPATPRKIQLCLLWPSGNAQCPEQNRNLMSSMALFKHDIIVDSMEKNRGPCNRLFQLVFGQVLATNLKSPIFKIRSL